MEGDVHSGETGQLQLQDNAGKAEDSVKSKPAPAFEEVLESIGSRGKFQTRLNVVFVCLAQCFNLMTVSIFYLAMQTPDHWCHVPGREHSNVSLEEWKNITIPREGGAFSKCLMYDQNIASNSTEAVKCRHGWEYDQTWLSKTAPTQMDWVCDHQHVVSDVLFYSQNIGVVLGLLFGYIGDMWGRRPQQLLCLAALVLSRLLLVLSPRVLILFILAAALVSAASGPLLECALSVGLELTDIEHRATVNRYGCCSTAFGIVVGGLVAWVLPDWNYFMSFAAVCCFSTFFFFGWFPESPRWLACRGREQEALEVLRHIANTNGCSLPAFARQVVRTVGRSKVDRTGFLAIFSSWNVFRNTTLLVIARSAYLLTMYSPMLAVSRLSENPFLGLSAQGVAQFLAYHGVNLCADALGRRWSGVAAPLLAAVAGATVFCLLDANISGTAIVAMTMVMQLGTTASLGVANLQSVEVHPTCLRQIAACLEWGVAGVVMSALPYLSLMEDKKVPFAILTAINLVTAFSVSFLPESALQRLPETLEDGALFGKGRRYWGWKPKSPAQLSQG